MDVVTSLLPRREETRLRDFSRYDSGEAASRLRAFDESGQHDFPAITMTLLCSLAKIPRSIELRVRATTLTLTR
jgi:hypothetical protein